MVCWDAGTGRWDMPEGMGTLREGFKPKEGRTRWDRWDVP